MADIVDFPGGGKKPKKTGGKSGAAKAKPAAKKNKGGRPPKGVNVASVKRLAAIGATVEEIAAFFDMKRAAFYEKLKADPALLEALEVGRSNARMSLRRQQFKEAMAGNTAMLIFLGKNLLGQTDKVEKTDRPPPDFQVVEPRRFYQQRAEAKASGQEAPGDVAADDGDTSEQERKKDGA